MTTKKAETPKLYPHQQAVVDAALAMPPEEMTGPAQAKDPRAAANTQPPDGGLPFPFHIVHMNRDYHESSHVVQSLRSAVVAVAQDMSVGMTPRKGVDEDFWNRVGAAYEENGWKGAAIFRIDTLDGTYVNPVGRPVFTSEEFNRAEITGRLSANPETPVWAVLMNRDFAESAVAVDSERAAIAVIAEAFDLNREAIEDAGSFPEAIDASYNNGGWKGFSVLKINAQTLEFEQVGPEDLPFEMSDLPEEDEPLAP